MHGAEGESGPHAIEGGDWGCAWVAVGWKSHLHGAVAVVGASMRLCVAAGGEERGLAPAHCGGMVPAKV